MSDVLTADPKKPAASAPAAPEKRLWTPGGFRQDEWTHAESGETLAGDGRFILPLNALLELDRQARQQARGRLGVVLQPGEKLEGIVPLLAELPLVALAFPAFNDGRSFSKAELLRSRHGFTGALRAVGQVLVDQLPHMLRLGFDQFEVSHPVLIRRLEAGEFGGLPVYYQPTARPAAEPAKGAAYAWRRSR